MLNTLSRLEVERLHSATQGDLYELVRQCSLAVLNSGIISDDAEALIEQYRDFRIEVQQVNRGLRLELANAPGAAFVDGKIIEGTREMLSSVIRDLVYFDSEIRGNPHHDLAEAAGITNAVFEMLRNAGALHPKVDPKPQHPASSNCHHEQVCQTMMQDANPHLLEAHKLMNALDLKPSPLQKGIRSCHAKDQKPRTS